MSRFHIAAVAALAAALASAHAARAQGSSEAAATALFDEGRKLMGEHKFGEACPKLAESERLAPSGGTLLNLADCYEHTGQTASAWVAWKDVASRANAAGKADVEKRALAKAAALEPALSKLTIAVVAGSDVSGLDVKRDGVAVGHTEFGLPIPVDPGAHVIEAIAPGKKAFSAKVDVAAKQTDARVTVTLEDDAQAVAPPPPVAPPATGAVPATPPETASTGEGSALKTVGVVVGAVGVAGIVVGSIFGLEASSKNQSALQAQNCRTSTLCTQNGLNLTNDARSAATISTIAFAAGGALVAGGVVLWLVAPSTTTKTGVRVVPLLSASAGGLSIDGGW
ncbi:MAG TPA: hypothetical protein VGL81_27585 [Polyangiaceae bacterium]|jgi:hypothetical protein